MGADVGSNRSGVRSDINITPLVDVVLVLLIIFMVITPMLQRGKSVELPKAINATSRGSGEPDPLFVSVTLDGKVYVETDEVTLDALIDKMKEAKAAKKAIMLKADQQTEYKLVRPILDRASKAGLTGISLAAEQIKTGK
ncbi:MAG: biopolymer transporter ExbD [Deltaproteobacteria bacterium]|nr:biopolymer transporter ExbD [Deltaproteobacteria bacterium]